MANQDWLSSRDFSIQASEKFWQTQSQRLDWIKPWKTLTTGRHGSKPVPKKVINLYGILRAA